MAGVIGRMGGGNIGDGQDWHGASLLPDTSKKFGTLAEDRCVFWLLGSVSKPSKLHQWDWSSASAMHLLGETSNGGLVSTLWSSGELLMGLGRFKWGVGPHQLWQRWFSFQTCVGCLGRWGGGGGVMVEVLSLLLWYDRWGHHFGLKLMCRGDVGGGGLSGAMVPRLPD